MAILAAVALATGIGAALATGDDERSGRRATAVLHDEAGQRVGVAVFKERHGKVTVSAAVSSLAPEFHGFHVHAVGECVPPFTSAVGHLDLSPDGVPHGEHAGDLPSLLVNARRHRPAAVHDRPLLDQRPLRCRRERADRARWVATTTRASPRTATSSARPACRAPTRPRWQPATRALARRAASSRWPEGTTTTSAARASSNSATPAPRGRRRLFSCSPSNWRRQAARMHPHPREAHRLVPERATAGRTGGARTGASCE